MLAGSACTAEPAPSGAPSGSSTTEADCVDLEHGGAHLALDLADGLHPLDPDAAALNNDYSTGDGITVEQLAWVLLGARSQEDADGVLLVYATDRSSRFSAIESLQRTIVESSGPSTNVRDLQLGRTRVAGRAAETAVVTGENGEYDAWTFTSGKTRFIVVTHQLPDAGAFALSDRVPDLLTAGRCTDS
jgi:hypothetical protein